MAVIAVTSNRRINDYLESVRRAGGDPVEVRPGSEEPDAILRRVHGVLLSGGGDVDPARYGQAPHPTYQPAEPGRDDFEIALARLAVQRGIPVLAICRGMQVLNVALGGTLVQDIPSQIHGALNHSVPEPSHAIAHDVWVTKGSRLAALIQDHLEDEETCRVNSRHHQAVDRPAPGFDVTATSPDGVVEGMELTGDQFCVAVQWHPENFWRTGEFRSLFEGFIRAADARQTR